MTLEKAIEIQTIHNDHNPNITDPERWEAHDLSIEAMKFIQAWRKALPLTNPQLLPGETRGGE